MKARSLIGLALLVTSACTSASVTPSASVTTTQPVWPAYFRIDFEAVPVEAGWERIDGYIYSSSTSFPATGIQVLAQALDASGSVVGQRIEWVPGVLPPSGRLYFSVGALPPANAYRVSVWHWEFLQSPSGGRRR